MSYSPLAPWDWCTFPPPTRSQALWRSIPCSFFFQLVFAFLKGFLDPSLNGLEAELYGGHPSFVHLNVFFPPTPSRPLASQMDTFPPSFHPLTNRSTSVPDTAAWLSPSICAPFNRGCLTSGPFPFRQMIQGRVNFPTRPWRFLDLLPFDPPLSLVARPLLACRRSPISPSQFTQNCLTSPGKFVAV